MCDSVKNCGKRWVRKVTCRDSSGQVVDDSFCSGSKPDESLKCAACHWQASDVWKAPGDRETTQNPPPCDNCEATHWTRSSQCMSGDVPVDKALCTAQAPPPSSYRCGVGCSALNQTRCVACPNCRWVNRRCYPNAPQ